MFIKKNWWDNNQPCSESKVSLPFTEAINVVTKREVGPNRQILVSKLDCVSRHTP